MTGDSRVSSPPATAYLRALTAEARYALGNDLVPLTRWPYRVGRESRQKTMLRIASPADDRRTGEALTTNELYLPEQASESVSREHFEIERTDSGFHLRDRQSLSGTWVEGRLVGGAATGAWSPSSPSPPPSAGAPAASPRSSSTTAPPAPPPA